MSLIISKKYKYIFFHLPKNAGVSISRTLISQEKSLQFKRYISYLFRKIFQTRDNFYFSLEQRKFVFFKSHISCEDFFNIFGEDIFADYYKFAVVRNPWDRMVSRYFYTKKITNKFNQMSFDDFLKYDFEKNLYTINQYNFCLDKNKKICLNKIIKFENLYEDFNIVTSKIFQKQNMIKHLNKSEHKNYREYYNKDRRDKVFKFCKKDIDYFNYEFLRFFIDYSKKFLHSNNSNFYAYAISKLHNTYKSNNFNFSKKKFNVFKKFFYLTDKNLIYSFKKKKLLIISNLISFKIVKKDIYFGNLDNLLKKNNITTIKVLRNHTNNLSHKLKNKINKKDILLSKRIEYHKEIFIIFKFISELVYFFFSKKYSLVKKYLRFSDFFSIISNLRLVYQLEKIIKVCQPKFIMFTFEGHAWERLLIFLCKKKYKNTILLGYQFSVIKPNQVGIFQELKKNYNPDYILTTGDIPNNLLKKKSNFKNIFKIGSSKFSFGLRKINKSIDLLVSLDENFYNTVKILDLCISFSIDNPKYKILIRPHPILSNDKRQIKIIKEKIYNFKAIKFSINSLNLDLSKSKYLLFTNSAISIEGLNYNVIPLYFKNKYFQNIFDKNFPLSNVIKNKYDLMNKLGKSHSSKSYYFKNYQNKYFEKFNLVKLLKIIKNKSFNE